MKSKFIQELDKLDLGLTIQEARDQIIKAYEESQCLKEDS